MLYTQDLLYLGLFILWLSPLHSPTPPPATPYLLTHSDGLSKEGWRALLSLVLYGFYSNKSLYSGSPLFTMFIGPAAVVRQVLQKRVCPSFPLSGCFLGIGSLVFSKIWHGARNPNELVEDRTRFFLKSFFCIKHWENGSKLGQK